MGYCDWFSQNEMTRRYHEEWGTPLYDDVRHFEYLSMEVMQCGLSFGLILKRRDVLNKCFDHFDYDKVADYDEQDVARIMHEKDMIHSEAKIRAIIHNARCFQQIRKEFGSFSDYIWSFTDHKTILYDHHETGKVPARNALSDKISRDLKKRGFKYMGSVVTYSYLQSCGIINDHDVNCQRRGYLIDHYPCVHKRGYRER